MPDWFLQQSFVQLVISCVNILRDKIPTFPVKSCSTFCRDLWCLVKFIMQNRKPIAKEAGCEHTGPDSVQLSSASTLLFLESPVSHSLWSESHRWQTSTAMGGVPQQTLRCLEGVPSTCDTHTEWHFHLRYWTSCEPVAALSEMPSAAQGNQEPFKTWLVLCFLLQFSSLPFLRLCQAASSICMLSVIYSENATIKRN